MFLLLLVLLVWSRRIPVVFPIVFGFPVMFMGELYLCLRMGVFREDLRGRFRESTSANGRQGFHFLLRIC